MTARRLALALVLVAGMAPAAELPKVSEVELQPLSAQVRRVTDALTYLGAPLSDDDRKALDAALANSDKAQAVLDVQAVLDRHCLAGVRIQGDKRLEVLHGPAEAALAEQGWRVFLVKVINPREVSKVELRPVSPNSAPLVRRSSGSPDPRVTSVGLVGSRF